MITFLVMLICFFVVWRVFCRMTVPVTVIEPPPPVAVTIVTPSIVIHVHKASITPAIK